jgi:hypothetical protein
MHTASYQSALNHVAYIAPTLDRPGEFIRWAEDIASLLSYIYSVGYDEATEDVYEAVKEEQGYEEE